MFNLAKIDFSSYLCSEIKDLINLVSLYIIQ